MRFPCVGDTQLQFPPRPPGWCCRLLTPGVPEAKSKDTERSNSTRRSHELMILASSRMPANATFKAGEFVINRPDNCKWFTRCCLQIVQNENIMQGVSSEGGALNNSMRPRLQAKRVFCWLLVGLTALHSRDSQLVVDPFACVYLGK